MGQVQTHNLRSMLCLVLLLRPLKNVQKILRNFLNIGLMLINVLMCDEARVFLISKI